MAFSAMKPKALVGCQRRGSRISSSTLAWPPMPTNWRPASRICCSNSGWVMTVARCPRSVRPIPKSITGWTSPALPMVGRRTSNMDNSLALLLLHELHAAVRGATIGGVIGSDRFGLAESLRGQAGGVDAKLRGQNGLHRLCAAVREIEIVIGVPDRIRVA